MAENTKIEWAHHTFNPWIGCTKVSPACDHCYAEADFATRLKVVQWGAGQPRKHTAPSTWAMPVKWDAEAARLGVRYRVFCASLADVFDNEVPGQWRIELMSLILATPHLDWLLLTKRIGNAAGMLETAFRAVHAGREGWADNVPANVWVGASITSQAEADRDIPKLLAVPAAKRFLSMEPLLGPVDLTSVGGNGEGNALRPLTDWVDDDGHRFRAIPNIHWVIVGGESGPGARPMHPEWARSLRDQCQAAGVPFLFKQWGEWAEAGPSPGNAVAIAPGGKTRPYDGTHYMCEALMQKVGKKAAGRLLDGRTWDEVPA